MLTDHFATNLKLLREQHGLKKSHLAEELWGTEVDSRGYTVAKNRSLISSWESGRSVPCEENLDRLSEYFGVFVQDLAPDVPDPRIRRHATPQTVLDNGKIKVRIEVSGSSAAEVAEVLRSMAEGW